ncbi:hypothetical protein LCGC14_1438720 [marine sediment metagenome]|uniref:Uncharacterized protein n=1 Tax=marine sediment metagenome TaxID=412755 RepID=A0A0F9MN69_9ZZZZ
MGKPTDPQAKEMGWYIEHGWTPPEELKMKEEGIRKDERTKLMKKGLFTEKQVIHKFRNYIKQGSDKIMGVVIDGIAEGAKREGRERVLSIIKEYSLESASARDDSLELRAIGWKLLWQALKGEK